MSKTEQRERPIIFSAAMVRAILDGTKTQTRRICKIQPLHVACEWTDGHPETAEWFQADEHGDVIDAPKLVCPYGKRGDKLWVRETWQHEDGSCDDHKCGQPSHIYHRATEGMADSMRWRPAIFMQRWASRLTLEVVSVRVERLQDLSPEDACAEGVFSDSGYQTEPGLPYPVATFKSLWDSINGKRAPWASNPWVWCVEFKKAPSGGEAGE